MRSIELKSVNKIYKKYPSNTKRVLSWFGFHFKNTEDMIILKDINFHIKKGESVGLIGQNGAGKSTLLKIITKTLKQTSGTIHTFGKISSILELGMGFHSDLTGKQNAYHSAGLMGYSKDEIDGFIDYIEDFSEIGEYFNKPVRLYSSGMQMRLAFAIVTAKRPEILIIDEALSVGDTYFQHKSFNKIREFRNSGTTLLLVSHDLMAIQSICSRAILLDKGQILKDDEPQIVLDFYNALIAKKENDKIEQKSFVNGKTITKSGNGDANISKIKILNSVGNEVKFLEVAQKVRLNITANINKNIDSLVAGILIKDRFGMTIYGTNSYHLGEELTNLKKGQTINFSFEFQANLGVGSYSVTVALHSGDSHLETNYEWNDNLLIFTVVNNSYSHFNGNTFLEMKLRIDNE